MTDPTPPNVTLTLGMARAQRLPGWCCREKAAHLVELVLALRPAVCVEVGVYGGRSAIPIALALRLAGGGRLVAVDPWEPAATQEDGAPDAAWWRTQEDGGLEAARRAFLDAVAAEGLGAFVEVRRGRSAEVAPAFGEAVDLLHIDGNHGSDAALRDVRLWMPKVRAGGLVVFDDSNWDTLRAALDAAGEACDVEADRYEGGNAWRVCRKR